LSSGDTTNAAKVGAPGDLRQRFEGDAVVTEYAVRPHHRVEPIVLEGRLQFVGHRQERRQNCR
jgi:hypothetical protein